MIDQKSLISSHIPRLETRIASRYLLLNFWIGLWSRRALSEMAGSASDDFVMNMISCLPLMCEVVAVYQTADIKLHGLIKAPPRMIEQDAVALIDLCSVTNGCTDDCVKTFEDFKQQSVDMQENDMRSWFTRMKLRYSCSSIAVAFVRFIVPDLLRHGVSAVLINGDAVKINSFRIWAVYFTPNKRHAVRFSTPKSTEPVTEVIEAALPMSDDTCYHNVLVAESGNIIDFSGGQFTGNMIPCVYDDVACYAEALPGKILHFEQCSDSDIEDQFQRDCGLGKIYPPLQPNVWAKQVVSNLHLRGFNSTLLGTSFCCACLGTPPKSKKLKHCARCKNAFYCGKACQLMDWRRHRMECL